MRQNKTKYRDCHSQKPLHVPNSTTSLRTILDRVSQGLPINTKISQHVPLPDDGMNMDDFDTGTEEYLDLVDVQQLDERIKAQEAAKLAKQREAKEKAEKDAFDNAVAEEIARRAAEQQN